MHKSIRLAILALLFFSGCAKPYVQPDGPDTAMLTFINLASVGVGILSFNVAEDCSGGKLYFNDGAALLPQQKTDIKIKADQAFSFSFGYNNGNKYCFMPATFSPRQGAKYIAKFAADPDNCYVSVVTVTDSGEKKEPTYKLRKWRTPFAEDGSFCE